MISIAETKRGLNKVKGGGADRFEDCPLSPAKSADHPGTGCGGAGDGAEQAASGADTARARNFGR